MQKGIMLVLSAVITILSLAGCNNNNNTAYKTNDGIANDYFDDIIKALDNNKIENIKKLFALMAIESTDDFNDSLSLLSSFYKGEMMSHDLIVGNGIRSVDEGETKWQFVGTIVTNVKTDKETYTVDLYVRYLWRAEPTGEGLWYLKFTNSAEESVEVGIMPPAYP